MKRAKIIWFCIVMVCGCAFNLLPASEEKQSPGGVASGSFEDNGEAINFIVQWQTTAPNDPAAPK